MSDVASTSLTAAENKRPTNVASPKENDANKKAKLDDDDDDDDSRITTFRSWSANVDENSSKSTIYTLKCIFGDPNKPLRSSVKNSKVDYIKELLQERGVSTTGTKKDLLERLQKDLPYVELKIDGRECLQRVVNSMLHYFDWDNTHLFECDMPRRGSLMDGVDTLEVAFARYMGYNIRAGTISANPDDHDKRDRRHYERRLQEAGLTWADLKTAVETPDALTPYRKLQGAAFAPYVKGCDDDERAQGGHLSLEELAVKAGDTITINYDLGATKTFVIQVISVESNMQVLPEVNHGHGNETRVKLVKSGNGKAHSQYNYA